MIRTAIIGAGRMGQIRARVMEETQSAVLVAVADPQIDLADKLAAQCGARSFTDWREAIELPEVDAVVVATPTMFHASIASAALAAGKHVLCEKPLARNVEEAAQIVAAAEVSGKLLKTGFNYRHLPHIRKAKELIDGGELGKLSFMRCHFGHGGRPGFEKEWHADVRLSGGGVLQEQGIHLMDLTRYLLGEPVRAFSTRKTLYWPLTEAEDNCFCLFETEGGQIAQIHVSWTQWINTFSMEIFGQDGYLRMHGRDGHYGPPRITWAKRNADHSRPSEQNIQYEPGEDWKHEWMEFLAAIDEKREPLGSGVDGLRAQRLIEAAYQSAATGQWIDVAAKKKA
jgi:predicted dehydrogenase